MTQPIGKEPQGGSLPILAQGQWFENIGLMRKYHIIGIKQHFSLNFDEQIQYHYFNKKVLHLLLICSITQHVIRFKLSRILSIQDLNKNNFSTVQKALKLALRAQELAPSGNHARNFEA